MHVINRVVSLCLSIAVGVVSAAILDPGRVAQGDPVLLRLADGLHQHDIDVVLGETTAFPSSERPRLARLAGFRAKRLDWNKEGTFSWTSAFEEGVVGALYAVKRNTSGVEHSSKLKQLEGKCATEPMLVDRESCDFVVRWLAARPDARVFIAFTRSDYAIAQNVKAELESAGYVVFVYLRTYDARPWADPDVVGEAFGQANQRFVIDTVHSRGSEGVQFEAVCERILTMPKEPRLPREGRWFHMLKDNV